MIGVLQDRGVGFLRRHPALMGTYVRADGTTHWRSGRYLKFVDRNHNDLLVSVAHAMEVESAPLLSGAMADFTEFGDPGYCKGPLIGLRR